MGCIVFFQLAGGMKTVILGQAVKVRRPDLVTRIRDSVINVYIYGTCLRIPRPMYYCRTVDDKFTEVI
jgi:hypothetical protein